MSMKEIRIRIARDGRTEIRVEGGEGVDCPKAIPVPGAGRVWWICSAVARDPGRGAQRAFSMVVNAKNDSVLSLL